MLGGQAQTFFEHVRCTFALLIEQKHFLESRESEFLIDIVADKRRLVIRDQNLVRIFRPGKPIVQFSSGKKLLSFHRGEVIELHLVAPAGKTLPFLVDRKTFGEPPRDLVIRDLKTNHVHELMPEGAAPIE